MSNLGFALDKSSSLSRASYILECVLKTNATFGLAKKVERDNDLLRAPWLQTSIYF